jgi:hypothetical protein
VRVSSSGGHEPVWSRDGKELFFTWGTRMMAAKVIALDQEARFDAPRQLFQGGFAYDMADLIIRFYDVAPDGRFLVVEPVETKNAWLVVAQHWDEEVRKLLTK